MEIPLERQAVSAISGIAGQLGTGKAFLRFVLHGFPKKSKRLGTGKAFLGFVLPGFHKPFGNLGTGKLTSSLFSLVDQMKVVHSQENSCLCPNAQTEAKIHGVHSQENGCQCPNAQTEAEIHAGVVVINQKANYRIKN